MLPTPVRPKPSLNQDIAQLLKELDQARTEKNEASAKYNTIWSEADSKIQTLSSGFYKIKDYLFGDDNILQVMEIAEGKAWSVIKLNQIQEPENTETQGESK